MYPDPFSGNSRENIFKFKEKFLDALEANQVQEKDKVHVLRGRLKDYPRDTIGNYTDVTSIKEAF